MRKRQAQGRWEERARNRKLARTAAGKDGGGGQQDEEEEEDAMDEHRD